MASHPKAGKAVPSDGSDAAGTMWPSVRPTKVCEKWQQWYEKRHCERVETAHTVRQSSSSMTKIAVDVTKLPRPLSALLRNWQTLKSANQ
jgi:hypothetical protein